MRTKQKPSEIDMLGIGERLRALRKSLRLTQDQMAERLGISKTHYGLAERGKSCLSLPLYLSIHNEFGITLDYLLAGEERSRNNLEELFSDCPKEKMVDLMQVIRHACNLCR